MGIQFEQARAPMCGVRTSGLVVVRMESVRGNSLRRDPSDEFAPQRPVFARERSSAGPRGEEASSLGGGLAVKLVSFSWFVWFPPAHNLFREVDNEIASEICREVASRPLSEIAGEIANEIPVKFVPL